MDVRKMASMGQKAMRKQQSRAERVFWPLQAGRPRNAKPSLLEAVHLGREAANRLYGAMQAVELRPQDAGCVLVLAKGPKLAGMALFTQENPDACDLEIAQKILKNKWEPIGIAFCLLDREKGHLLSHARPFERSERNECILSSVLDEWGISMKRGEKLRYEVN